METTEAYYKKAMSLAILIVLLFLSFLTIKPILLSIVFGIILAFIFNPIYNLVLKVTKSKNISALLICLLLILLVLVPLWFLTPLLINQTFEIYVAAQNTDFVTPLKTIFSSFFPSEKLSTEIGPIIQSFVSNLINSLVNSLGELLLNFPTILLRLTVVFFTLFFTLRDKEELFSYLKSLSPFTQEVEKKISSSSKKLTNSVIYGNVVIGLIQGIVAGAGFFLFGIPNALFYTLLAVIVGILPIVGPAIVFIPVFVYLLVTHQMFAAWGVLFFGILSSIVDNFLRPLIVSRKSEFSSFLILIGMIGGTFFFGFLGFILGPLILAYLVIIIDLHRKKLI